MTEKPDHHVGVLENVLKYGSAIVAAAYVSGFVVEMGYLSHLPPSFYDVDFSPRLMANGAVFLWLFAVVPLSSVFLSVVRHFDSGHAPWVENVGRCFLLIFLPVSVMIVWHRLCPFHELLVQPLVLISEVLLCAITVFPVANKPHQGAIVFVVAISLLNVADASGNWEWEKNQGQGQGIVRLLIAPDAVGGAEELGMVFPEKGGAGSARLSAQVVMLYSGPRTYTFRLENRQIVQLSKDKVWGMGRR